MVRGFCRILFSLSLFRGGVIIAAVKGEPKYADDERKSLLLKWRIYLASGAFLIIVEIAMAAAVTQMMLSKRPTQSGQIMAITNAAYTFYKMSMAIYNIIKARKQDDPVIRSLRNLNFADACMATVSLTVLMLDTFDGGEDISMLYLKSMVGFAACAAIIVIATIMIISANKRLNALKGETSNE